jgi:hypothetical protein
VSDLSFRSKRLLLVAAAITGAALLLFLAVAFLYTKTPSVSGNQVLQAVQRFAATHRPLPEQVTFSQLIAEGFLPPNALKDFGASEVTIRLRPDARSPQGVLMDALMPDGTHTTLLVDGSVLGLGTNGLR